MQNLCIHYDAPDGAPALEFTIYDRVLRKQIKTPRVDNKKMLCCGIGSENGVGNVDLLISGERVVSDYWVYGDAVFKWPQEQPLSPPFVEDPEPNCRILEPKLSAQ